MRIIHIFLLTNLVYSGHIRNQDSAMVTILNVATYRVLDSNDNLLVFTGLYNGGPFQNWKLEKVDDGGYVIEDIVTGYVLDSNYKMVVETNDPSNSKTQIWIIDKGPKGAFIIKNMATSKVLDSNSKGDVYTRNLNGGDY